MKRLFLALLVATVLTTGYLSAMALNGNARMLVERGITVEIFLFIIVFLLSAWAVILFLIFNPWRVK